jgi:PhzF family phenazine biosynthesis protein
MSCAVYQVDAFTHDAFAGNPAAVCLLPEARPDAWLQNVAGEMNLSETAFLRPRRDGTYRLRWFTPTHEVDLCGHATLASAHVLWTEGFLAPDAPAQFDTASGPLSATREAAWITMDFPTDPPRPLDPPPSLLDALGETTPTYTGRSDRDLFVHLSSAEAVRALDPDLSALAALDARGVIVTAAADGDVDFVSRFFAPGVGVPEDPVTGSAHCTLGPYWAERLGQSSLRARQVSARGGTVRVACAGPEADRLGLSGRAVTTLRGRLAA